MAIDYGWEIEGRGGSRERFLNYRRIIPEVMGRGTHADRLSNSWVDGVDRVLCDYGGNGGGAKVGKASVDVTFNWS